jgi:hypothetical protein
MERKLREDVLERREADAVGDDTAAGRGVGLRR